MGVPLPPADLLLNIVDTLAKRYGWSYVDMTEEMYWEDLYSMYEHACNMEVIEQNEKLRFNFMLHATSKEALDKWKDTPIPFPKRSWEKQVNKKKAVKKTPTYIFGQQVKRVKGNDKDTKRYHEVLDRMKKHKKLVEKRVEEYYQDQYS